jgi:uncharacterized DUF497 family protein
MRLPKLLWDTWNKEHIKKHKVSVFEAEEAYHTYYAVAETYDKRKIYLGKTKKSRLITVIVSFKKQKGPYVLSVRDTSKKERRLYL